MYFKIIWELREKILGQLWICLEFLEDYDDQHFCENLKYIFFEDLLYNL